MDRYNVGLFVTGQIETDKENPEEEIENIITQIIAHTDLFWAHVDVDFVTKTENKEELTSV